MGPVIVMVASVPELLTVKQVAGILQVHEQTVWRYLREGTLPSVRLGRRVVRIARNDLDAFIASRRTVARSGS
jgi:excisionase family DNA binding protein